MASYRVEIAASAEQALAHIPKADAIRVVRAIGELATTPRPRGCRKLAGHEDVYRIRVGMYRVIYSIDDRRIIIVVLKLGHRKSVYG